MRLDFYERLHLRAYDTSGDGLSRTMKDSDIATAYQALVEMRRALIICRDQFDYYRLQDEHSLEAHLTLVERQGIASRLATHREYVKMINGLLETVPVLPADEWRPISSAPQDGQPIRLLGRRVDGTVYIETGRWENIHWSVEQSPGHLPPAMWHALEKLPEGYQ